MQKKIEYVCPKCKCVIVISIGKVAEVWKDKPECPMGACMGKLKEKQTAKRKVKNGNDELNM